VQILCIIELYFNRILSVFAFGLDSEFLMSPVNTILRTYLRYLQASLEFCKLSCSTMIMKSPLIAYINAIYRTPMLGQSAMITLYIPFFTPAR